MLQVEQAREILAGALEAVGVPVERNLAVGYRDHQRLPLAVRIGARTVAFDVCAPEECQVLVRESGWPGIPLVDLPTALVVESASLAVDVALAALLAIGAPEVSGQYLRLLSQLSVAARGRRRRMGKGGSWQARPCLLRWPDVRSALTGGRLRAIDQVRRRLTTEQHRYWILLRAEVEAEQAVPIAQTS